MVPASRKILFALCAGFVLLAVGCESNNKGKIVGLWKASGANSGIPAGAPADAGMFFEFTADGKFRAYVQVGGNTSDITKGKYSLGTGDFVNLSDLSPAMDGKTRSKEKISITGDTMTVAGEAGKALTFTRVK